MALMTVGGGVRTDGQQPYDPSDGEVLASVNQACEIVGVSRRTLYNWMAKGLVEVRRTPSGTPRIVISSLWRRSAA